VKSYDSRVLSKKMIYLFSKIRYVPIMSSISIYVLKIGFLGLIAIKVMTPTSFIVSPVCTFLYGYPIMLNCCKF